MNRPEHAALARFDEASVAHFAKSFEVLFNHADSASMARFYASDAKLIAENMAVVEGQAQIEEFWRLAYLRPEIKRRRIEIRKIESVENMGYVVGVVFLEVEPATLGASTISVNYTTIWMRDQDGFWRIVVDISCRGTADSASR